MRNTDKKIEMNVYCVEHAKDFELSYLDVKEANDAVEAARASLKTSVKTLRVYLRSKITLELHVSAEYQQYRKATKQAKILSDRYFEQCERKRW